METTTMTEAAMCAARVSRDVVRYGANTAHAVDLGQIQGRAVSATGITVRGHDLLGVITGPDFARTPATGSAYPRLEGPPV